MISHTRRRTQSWAEAAVRTTRGEQPEPQQARSRRGDSGLTTLEWLLIVAAVAGLAALAVVLVQRVVGDTGEQISGSSARETAAKVAAARVTDEARADLALGTDQDEVDAQYGRECRRLRVLYSDAGITTNYMPDPITPECEVSATSSVAAPGAFTVTYVDPNLNWTAASGVTSYSVSCSGAGCPTATFPIPNATSPQNVGSLVGSSASYTFTVTATNSGGTTRAVFSGTS